MSTSVGLLMSQLTIPFGTRRERKSTYRTFRVLAAIAAQPGASNREVADAAGIRDQGQISKLLARLNNLELLASAPTRGAGEPHAWRLTQRGEQLERVARAELKRSALRDGVAGQSDQRAFR